MPRNAQGNTRCDKGRGAFCLLILCLLCAFAVWARAGEKAVEEGKQAEPPEAESWSVKLASPLWLASAWGKTGVLGKTANVDVSAKTILRHASFLTSLSAEARKGPFGVYGDFLYLGDQAGVFTNGLIYKTDVKFDEYLADLDVSWRIINSPRGWLDVLAGARYMNIYTRLQLQPNDGRINAASERLVNTASAAVGSTLDRLLDGVLDGKNPVLPIPPLAGSLERQMVQEIRHAQQNPELAAAIASGDPVRIARAQQAVAANIASILRKNLSRAFSICQGWVDPYVGLRARYNLSEAFYVTAKGDVGGFGAGSQVSAEAIGAVGCQITRRVWAEAGYKYLYVDYRRGGFVYDISNGGALVTVGVNF